MDLKVELRTVIDANPQPIKFVLKYSVGNKEEVFTTKQAFGKRLLEIMKNREVKIYMVKVKGCFEQVVTGLIAINKPVVNIERITFLVI